LACPLRNPVYWTCGTPGETVPTNPPEQLGCWCRLPLAAKLPQKRCYLDINNQPGGWGET
jgi:hypothetical protein